MRKIWKKLAAAGLAAAMTATALTGCGGKESAPAGSEAQTEASSEPVETTSGTTPVNSSISLELSAPMQTSVCTFARAKAFSGCRPIGSP